jgi:hypothetical protein
MTGHLTHVPQPNLKNRILDSAPKALLESSPSGARVQDFTGRLRHHLRSQFKRRGDDRRNVGCRHVLLLGDKAFDRCVSQDLPGFN